MLAKPVYSDSRRINFVFDISIYDEDNILEFKEKIFVASGVPIYRQHVWHGAEGFHKVGYTVHTGPETVRESILSFTDGSEYLEGIEISSEYHANIFPCRLGQFR